MKPPNNLPTIGLVPGFGHNEWFYEPVKGHLEEAGFRVITPHLDIEDPDASFDDHAGRVVETMGSEEDLVLVGHSRGCNITLRAASRLAVGRLVHVAASVDKSTVPALRTLELPVRNTDAFRDCLQPLPGGMWRFDPETVAAVLYDDCPEDVQKDAISKLRPQRRSANEPVLDQLPDVEHYYVACLQDNAITSEWQKAIARQIFDVTPIEIPTSHSPFLSYPSQTARLLMDIAMEPPRADLISC